MTRAFVKMDILKMSKNEKSFGELPKKTKSVGNRGLLFTSSFEINKRIKESKE